MPHRLLLTFLLLATPARAHLLDSTNLTDAGHPTLWSHLAYAHQSVYWRNDKELIRASLAPEPK